MSYRSADQALLDDKPWGYRVRVYFNNGKDPEVFFKQGTKKAVGRWAMLKSNAREFVITEAFTRKEWLRCFGDGRGKQS